MEEAKHNKTKVYSQSSNPVQLPILQYANINMLTCLF